jgi:hypothetical protein
MSARISCALVGAALALAGCNKSDGNGSGVIVEGVCEIASGSATPDYVQHIGCTADFQALASEPIDATLPGARSTKVVLDQQSGTALYFQNTVKYQIHYEFASTHLSGNGLPVVPALAEFNASQYYTPDRRFILGAVTYYEQPKQWTLELAPYDTATADMMATLFRAVKAAGFFGPGLAFHPTSEAVTTTAAKLPSDIPIVTTDQLYAGIDFQPLSLASGIGQLRFVKVADLDSVYLTHQDIVVLDLSPVSISAVMGLITEEFQTPLSHLNVLSRNRHTPNMGLRGAWTNTQLRGLEGKPVELVVRAESWTIREVTDAEAQAYWTAHKPTAVVLPTVDLSVTGLRDIAEATAETSTTLTLRDAIKAAVCAFGGKVAHYSVLARIKNVPTRKAFGIPIFYYDQFMKENGFYDQVDALMADASFVADYRVRQQKLAELRAAMLKVPVNAELQQLLKAKLTADYPGLTMRFRSSTNSEDLEAFPCAGCYESYTGDPSDWDDLLTALRSTWSSVWLFRSFEERSYYGVDQKSVGMGVLCHHNFTHDTANGVAITANPFDASGLDPAFYINVQQGDEDKVVRPISGVTSDELLYFFSSPNQPVSYMTHSSIIPAGTTVLTAAQIHKLGVALSAIHTTFSSAYGPGAGISGWYAMDVEFKLDNEGSSDGTSSLYIKQSRPYPKPGE